MADWEYIRMKKKMNLQMVGWLVVLLYGVSTLFGLFNAELNFKQFSLA